jgi:hypothetical protein
MRQKLEREGCLAPGASRDAGSNHEPIMAMAQAVVVGDAARDGAYPVLIEILQTIRVSYTLRGAQIYTSVPELHAPIAGR